MILIGMTENETSNFYPNNKQLTSYIPVPLPNVGPEPPPISQTAKTRPSVSLSTLSWN
jgi:hypothetical protein